MLYALTLISLAALDFTWLSLMSETYRSMLSHLFAPTFSFAPALMFYPLYALAIYVLVLEPAIRAKTGVLKVILLGALLGLAAYGAYDLTNQATLTAWPVFITALDMAWGACLTAASSGIAYTLYVRLKK